MKSAESMQDEVRHHRDLELLTKHFFLYLVAFASGEGEDPAFVYGAPEDSNKHKLWSMKMVAKFREVVSENGMRESAFDQGDFGHPKVAPTRFLHNVGMEVHEGVRDARSEGERKAAGGGLSSTRLCPGVRRVVADSIRARGIGDGRDQSDYEGSFEIRKMTKEQGWRLHLLRDHVPFRRDCEQCVMSLGTGRQHRRVKQRSAHVLSVDVGGPMRVKSKDAHGSGYKFFLAAAYSMPRFPDVEEAANPLPEDLAAPDYDFADLEIEEEPEDEHLSMYEPSDVEEGLEPAAKKVTAADKLWDDDKEAAEIQEKDEKENEEEGNAEIPMDYLYFVKPLKSKAGKHVKMAIQELVLQLRHENLPVVRIHSDRAHEMRSAALREWTLNNNILLTRTEGQSPQANGTAERAIRFMKGKARMLLRSSGLDTRHWATAMITAAYNQREERLRPETHKPVCPYGSPVAIKKKRYGQGGKYDLLPRWTKGVYLGPVWDVGGGSAVLEDETRRITVTTHIRPRLHDPGVVAEEPVIEFEPPVRRRLRRKVPVDDDGLEIKAARMKILNEGEAYQGSYRVWGEAASNQS